ncbi:hypothetical protein WJX84_009851 [Apatococcus fuscideae]|uniref:Uncharacterized protein n=1 Tax=Apatococcus fuscideae TaxID=2026836 RepID=A0AAW1T6D6_9CHLO
MPYCRSTATAGGRVLCARYANPEEEACNTAEIKAFKLGSSHVGKYRFRLIFGIYAVDTNRLIGTACSAPIRVLANNDRPGASALGKTLQPPFHKPKLGAAGDPEMDISHLKAPHNEQCTAKEYLDEINQEDDELNSDDEDCSSDETQFEAGHSKGLDYRRSCIPQLLSRCPVEKVAMQASGAAPGKPHRAYSTLTTMPQDDK